MRTSFLPALLLPVALFATSAHAFGFSPFKAQLAPEGLGSSQVFELRNDEDYPQAIQVSVQRWAQSVSGTEVNQPADDVLAVYPTQFVLKPKTSQTIRVRYNGSTPASEQAFRVVAEQLPVDLVASSDVRKAIRFLVTYRAALYVTPTGAAPDVNASAVREVTHNGQRYLGVTVRNQGNAHTLLKKPVFTFNAPQGKVTVKADGIAGVDGENLHAGSTRELMVPWPAELKQVPQQASIAFLQDF